MVDTSNSDNFEVLCATGASCVYGSMFGVACRVRRRVVRGDARGTFFEKSTGEGGRQSGVSSF